jgi:hypothetical protein
MNLEEGLQHRRCDIFVEPKEKRFPSSVRSGIVENRQKYHADRAGAGDEYIGFWTSSGCNTISGTSSN